MAIGNSIGEGLVATFLSALQASISVILTLFYGLVAARYGLVNENSGKDVSKLCVKMFLPALVITNVGKQMNAENMHKYVPIFVWSIVYTMISMGYGKVFERLFRLPGWTSAACTFNNTTSLPLLLVQSLAVTGFLDNLAGDDVSGAVERAKSYFLINSMISNGATFAFGPKLVENRFDAFEDGNAKDQSQDENNAQPNGQESSGGPRDEESGPDNADESVDEQTHLIPGQIRGPVSRASTRTYRKLQESFDDLPKPIRSTLNFLYTLINAPLIGAIIAMIIGLTPFLNKAFFNKPQSGGIFRAWLTNSIENIGELFTVLQMFVVGSKLSASLDAQLKARKKQKYSNRAPTQEEENDIERQTGKVPIASMLVIFLLRFALWPVASIFIIGALAHKASLLSDDPILWFSMILMPAGPPAILLMSLAELSGTRKDKMSVARLITISYAITPVICFTVVGGLKTCEWILDKR